LLLEGDAGIGKTALWQECNRLARERGFRVLTSRSAHSEQRAEIALLVVVFDRPVSLLLLGAGRSLRSGPLFLS
jgi:hypothetical protein